MSTALGVGLLLVAVVPLLLPGRPWLTFAVPPILAVAAVAGGVLGPAEAGDALRPLAAPLAFVLLAVPLAVMLDELGLFEALAGTVAAGPRYLGGCWVLAALVTALLNLDAAVVLLAPLYVRVARRRGSSRAGPQPPAAPPLLPRLLRPPDLEPHQLDRRGPARAHDGRLPRAPRAPHPRRDRDRLVVLPPAPPGGGGDRPARGPGRGDGPAA